MSSLQRDANRKSVGAGVSIVDIITPTPLQVDPITSRLLIDVSISTNAVSVLATEVGRDQNRRTTAYGVTDNAGKTLSPLLIDHTNGYLFVDIAT